MDKFIALVEERRELQNKYYDTGNEDLLAEIEQARERVQEMIRIMGLKI